MRGLLGKKAKKLPQNDAQLSLAILGLMLGGGEEPAPPPVEEEEKRVVSEHTRKVPKHRAPSDDWPRVYIELVPPEVEREGLDAFDVIGQESRGVLERRPASCVFVEVVRKKFVRKADKQAMETSVLIADPLSLPIAKGIAGPSRLVLPAPRLAEIPRSRARPRLLRADPPARRNSEAARRKPAPPRLAGFRSLSSTSLRRSTPAVRRLSGRGCPNRYILPSTTLTLIAASLRWTSPRHSLNLGIFGR